MNKYLSFLLQPPITKHFRAKLVHNFHTLTPGEMVIYFTLIRPFWSAAKRFYFEGSLGILGQMYIAERKAIFEIITTYKPAQCFEIGTFTGGGSTYFTASALAQNGTGKLYTIENDTHYFNKAKRYFTNKLPTLAKSVDFIFADTPTVFDQYLTPTKKVDCVFFDGAEDGQQTVDQYSYFKPYYQTGSIAMFHDWNTEKTRLVKGVIQADPRWKLLIELTPPTSVGFAAFIYQ